MSKKDSLTCPFWCPLCELPMKMKSLYSYYDYGCCVNCKIQFIEGREERWNSGWRPSQEELDAYIATFSFK